MAQVFSAALVLITSCDCYKTVHFIFILVILFLSILVGVFSAFKNEGGGANKKDNRV